jgi:hypothetical protein
MANDDKGEDKKVHVSIITTAGNYPTEGYNAVPANQPVSVELEKAAEHLKIKDTAGWVAQVGGTAIDQAKSYHDNNLSGNIDIDYGPPHGGGGAHA